MFLFSFSIVRRTCVLITSDNRDLSVMPQEAALGNDWRQPTLQVQLKHGTQVDKTIKTNDFKTFFLFDLLPATFK